MFTRKIPFVYSFLFLIAGFVISYFLFERKVNATEVAEAENGSSALVCNTKISRIEGFKFIRPLLFAEQECESPRFSSVKSSLSNLIQGFKSTGTLTSASVYLRVFKRGEWMSLNDTETFNPGSLIKVPVLMTYLRESESNPSLLKKEITFTNPGNIPKQEFNSTTIQPGHKYTIEQLLKYMVAYSDNNATFLLNYYIDVPALKKTFTDLGIAEPNVQDRNYQITAREYSLFIKALYNGSYLSRASSEYALNLLSESSFKDGMVKGLPPSTLIVHKFGEGGTMQIHQLHETGIIYIDNISYLLTIMTKGPEVKKLPEVLTEVSRMVYKSLSENKTI